MIDSLTASIWLIVIPLLSLTADTQMKMEQANEDYGAVEVHHMDELPSDGNSALSCILCQMTSIEKDSSSIIFYLYHVNTLQETQVFGSPFLNALVNEHLQELHLMRCICTTNTSNFEISFECFTTFSSSSYSYLMSKHTTRT